MALTSLDYVQHTNEEQICIERVVKEKDLASSLSHVTANAIICWPEYHFYESLILPRNPKSWKQASHHLAAVFLLRECLPALSSTINLILSPSSATVQATLTPWEE